MLVQKNFKVSKSNQITNLFFDQFTLWIIKVFVFFLFVNMFSKNVFGQSTYSQSVITYNWESPANAITTASCDDCDYTRNIGFTFNFFGNNYTQVNVNTNGLMTFGSTTNSFSNVCIPNSGAPNNIIAAYWDDLLFDFSCSPTYFREQTFGTAPNRYYVVSWIGFGRTGSSCSSYIYFQAKLYETSNIIEVHVQSNGLGTNNSGTIGIENSSGVVGYQAVCNSNPGGNYARRWTPIPDCTAPTVFTLTGGGTCLSGPSAVGLSGSQVGVNYQLKKNGVNQGSAIAGTGSAISFGNQTDGTYTVEASGSGYCTVTFSSSVSVSLNSLSISGTSSLCAGASTTLTVNGLSSSSGTNYTTTYNSSNGTMQTVFTGNGTFVNGSGSAITAKTLLVGGGGGGAARHGGGGGGGGVLYNASMSIPVGNLPVVIGAGGGAGDYENNVNHGNGRGAGGNGGNTTFNGSTAYGGGGGKTYENNTHATPGGSGGGGGGNTGTVNSGVPGGTQGNAGGAGPNTTNGNAGGGGGAGAAGGTASGNNGGNGGDGSNQSANFGTSVGQNGWFGGGGGGGSRCGSTGGTTGTGGVGGNGGGGRGGDLGNHTNGTAGIANTGGGGGGNRSCNTTANFAGFAGGSGVVILNYPAGVWSSSNTAVATVTQTGVVTATASATGGLATITYSSVGGCSTSFIIEKIAAPTITSTVANETCSSLNDGSISAVNISGGLSKVRYIRIKQNLTDAQDGWLHPAELKAFEIFTDADVAAGKTATSSGLSYAGGSYPASNLVDGNTSSIYHSGAMGVNEWVEIDLGAEYNLDRIQIWSGNCCYTTRFNNMQLILKNGAGTVIHSRQIAMNDNSGVATSYTFNVLDVSWSDGATTLNRSSLDAGSYTLNYSDASGCGTVAHTKVIGTTNPNLPASVSIAASPNTNICLGTTVTFTATPTNGGTTPSYQWKVNGGNVGTNSTTFASSSLVNGDVVTCVLTSNATPCLTGSPATSTGITMSIQASGSPLSGNESKTCVVNGNDWVRFYGSTGLLLGAIRANNNNLGNVTMQTLVSMPGVMNACAQPSNPLYSTVYMGRTWVMNSSAYPSGANFPSNVTVRLPFNNSELTSLNTAADASTTGNPNDGGTTTPATLANLMLTKITGATENGVANAADCASTILGITANAGTGTNYLSIASTSYIDFNVGQFSEFFLHKNNANMPLPVELISFSGTCTDKGTELTWQTASESNNDYFIVQRSRDGQNWEDLTTVSGNGNSTQLIDYDWLDEAGFGDMYYRLTQVDFNGDRYEKQAIFVNCESESTKFNVYPNPTQADFTVEVNSTKEVESATISIIDVTGKALVHRNVEIHSGVNTFNFGDQLESGTYLIRVSIEGEIQTLRLVVKN